MRTLKLAATSTLVTAIACAVSQPSHAFTTVPGGTFTLSSTGEGPTSTPQAINFGGTTPPPNAAILSKVKLIFNNTKFDGSATLVNLITSPNSAAVVGTLQLTFSGPGPNLVVTTGTSSTSPFSIPAGIGQVISESLVGISFNPNSLVIDTLSNPALTSYFAGGASITSSLASFTLNPVAGGVATNFSASRILGTFDVQYEYVPGPLPIFGVATAFLHSRRLRKRIKTSTT